MIHSFYHRLSDPDEDFLFYIRVLAHMLPPDLSFMAVFIFLISLVTEAVLDKASSLLTFFHWFTVVSMWLIVLLIAISIVVLQGLKLYISVKLKKKQS
jgi:hypothetical protein